MFSMFFSCDLVAYAQVFAFSGLRAFRLRRYRRHGVKSYLKRNLYRSSYFQFNVSPPAWKLDVTHRLTWNTGPSPPRPTRAIIYFQAFTYRWTVLCLKPYLCPLCRKPLNFSPVVIILISAVALSQQKHEESFSMHQMTTQTLPTCLYYWHSSE